MECRSSLRDDKFGCHCFEYCQLPKTYDLYELAMCQRSYISNAEDETVLGKCLSRAFLMEEQNNIFIYVIKFVKYLCIGEAKKKSKINILLD